MKSILGMPVPVDVEATGRVRLRTLVYIRWIAVAGQALTLIGIHFGFGFELPIVSALIVVAAAALLNISVSVGRQLRTRLSTRAAVTHLAFDIVQLSLLLMLTGGLENPFAVLILAPVIVSASVLPRASTIGLGVLTGGCITLLAFAHLPVPIGEAFRPPLLYVVGVWEALVLATLFIGIYVGSVAEQARQMSDALAATQMALEREQRLSALGALAAAAAHELGSPLSTIALTAKEMARDLPADSPLAPDVDLLIGQSERCRDILAGLTRRPEAEGGDPFSRIPVSTLVEAAAAPHHEDGVAVTFEAGVAMDSAPDERAAEPIVARSPEALHGLGNLIQNAIQHARKDVNVMTRWTNEDVSVTISDDGPGFPAAVRDRLGEPYVSDDRRREGKQHMGLGIFIASTLLARTGASVELADSAGGRGSSAGAEVRVSWPRAALEGES